jgi:hypothetical protein
VIISSKRNLDWLRCPLDLLFKDAGHEVAARWLPHLEKALAYDRKVHHRNAILIEVAAQHPLVDGVRPGTEFQARLDKGIELYKDYVAKGYHVEFFVPGSLHIFEKTGVPDKISLTDAGCAYLAEKGIPKARIHGQDLIDAYIGRDGVYGGADECFVTASYFKDKYFGSLVSVAAPAQARRKELHYVWLNVLAKMAPASAAEYHHAPATETKKNIPSVLGADDPSFQTGKMARFFRQLRMPNYHPTLYRQFKASLVRPERQKDPVRSAWTPAPKAPLIPAAFSPQADGAPRPRRPLHGRKGEDTRSAVAHCPRRENLAFRPHQRRSASASFG